MFAHNVFFSLNDAGQPAVTALVNDCHKYLADHPGMLFYAAGTLSDVARPVSDRDYDVALHVIFTDRAAHDAYQSAPAHQEFIARNKANWKKVRVFDSDVSVPGR
jgi:quinol monooxygenase YgiN